MDLRRYGANLLNMLCRNRRRIWRILDRVSSLVIALFFMILLYVLLRIFVYSTFTIPTESMYPVIRPGDRVLVDKVTTGARLYDIRGIVSGKNPDIYRVPGCTGFKRGDLIVFNFPHVESWDKIAFNWNQYYLKRCIACPGDTVSIAGFQYYVNSERLNYYPSADLFERVFPADSIARAQNLRGYMVNVSDTTDRWTIRDYGPLLVPGKGLTLSIDCTNVNHYKSIIEWETGDKVNLYGDSVITLGTDTLNEYSFKENYYFAAGDCSLQSLDSRYWGLVPESFIVGRAWLILYSKDKVTGNMIWNRFMKKIQ